MVGLALSLSLVLIGAPGAAPKKATKAGKPAPAASGTAAPAPAPAPAQPQPAGSPADAEAQRVMTGHEATRESLAPPTAARAARSQAVRVAVYDFESQSVSANVATVASASLLAEMRKLQGVSAIGMSEIRDMLSHEAEKQMLGCEGTESCLAEIAGALGVDELVSGKLTGADTGQLFVLRRLDQRRARIAGSVTQNLVAGSGEEVLAAIGPAVEKLFPDYPLRAGTERGVAKALALRLSPPPLPTWSFWGVSGAAVVAAGAGTVLGLLARDAQREYTSLGTQAQTTTIDGAALKSVGDRAKSRALQANVAFGTAGVLLVSAAVMSFFTDWNHYREAAAAAN
jgi:hypothetical protein